MGPKRPGQDEGSERTSAVDSTLLASSTLRTGASLPDEKPKKEEENYSLFWRVFGGTILSIAALVCATIFNNLSSSISELRAEVNRTNEARVSGLTELRNDLARLHEARADLVRKDEFNSRISNNWDRVQMMQAQTSSLTATLTSLKTELDAIKDRTTKMTTDLEAVKKDQSTSTDALKKDVAALEALKEKLSVAVIELKSTRDDLTKLTLSVDRNQAYDLERKASRDVQYKQIDETLKDLQKGLQESREKLARLEGQYAPVGLGTLPVIGPTPPKKSTPKTAPKTPTEPKSPPVEQAPYPRALSLALEAPE